MIEIKDLSKIYRLKNKLFHAVQDVNLEIYRGEILGLVGQSGSGKSTLGKMILGLIPPTSGEIYFDGKILTKVHPLKMQMIFQDPNSSLNPRMTIEKTLEEPTKIHRRENRVNELLDLVSLPTTLKNRYPHELSGGQKQRIAIARALALNPELLISDESISSLDVSIQAQIINLLIDLQKKLKLTILFIGHDLAVIKYVSDRVAVMNEGKIVEIGKADELFTHPQQVLNEKFNFSLELEHHLDKL